MALPHHPRFLLVVGVSSRGFSWPFISGVLAPKFPLSWGLRSMATQSDLLSRDPYLRSLSI